MCLTVRSSAVDIIHYKPQNSSLALKQDRNYVASQPTTSSVGDRDAPAGVGGLSHLGDQVYRYQNGPQMPP